MEKTTIARHVGLRYEDSLYTAMTNQSLGAQPEALMDDADTNPLDEFQSIDPTHVQDEFDILRHIEDPAHRRALATFFEWRE